MTNVETDDLKKKKDGKKGPVQFRITGSADGKSCLEMAWNTIKHNLVTADISKTQRQSAHLPVTATTCSRGHTQDTRLQATV